MTDLAIVRPQHRPLARLNGRNRQRRGFGLDHAEGLGLVPLGALVALAIVAAGSLVVTIGALTIGPQVVAFLRLTGTDRGLVALHDPDNPFATRRVERLVSRPMLVALVIEALLAAVTLSQLR